MLNNTITLAKIFAYEHLDEEIQERRTLLILLVGLTCLAGFLFSLTYLYLGVWHTTLATAFYLGFSGLNLVYFYLTKNYSVYRNAQLVGILLFPFLAHLFNGGFEQSSAVVLASILSPLGALMFHDRQTSKVFFGSFIFILLFSLFIDLWVDIPSTDLSKEVRLSFFFLNLSLISLISFSLLYKFVKDNDEIKSLLKQKNKELEIEKKKAEEALEELKYAQNQLVHSEKMASLGELTAGIAHEIQNPLNFVKNFSEVGVEFLDDLKEELNQKNYEEVNLIINDLQTNLEKIHHHGNRADSIVKAMLQHSSTSKGEKTDIDLNSLADEFVRLAYHGLRAKDKSFYADLNTEFVEDLPRIKGVPQDLGRVVLNIVTNAFYAVSERKQEEGEGFTPQVTLKTSHEKGRVKLLIRDNAFGVPDHVKDKIFQPFFTTKPTGKGTGLGLSLAFDIVKAHGGEIQLETKKGEGTTFSIYLPIRNTNT